MARFLFWNLCNRPLEELVSEIVGEQDIQFVILAEAERRRATILSTLNATQTRFRFHPTPTKNSSVDVYSTLPTNAVHSLRDSGRLSFRRITPPIGGEFLLVTAHLPSKMHQKPVDQAQLCTVWSRLIESEEDKLGHRNTLFVGDLNMNPFEEGMVSGFGFHAVRTKERALKVGRKINGFPSRPFFYNPMWRLLGDHENTVAGTFHHTGSTAIEYFWHVLDQVLVRPGLLHLFDDKETKILSRVGQKSLLTDNLLPSTTVASDHLPLIFQLNFERAGNDN